MPFLRKPEYFLDRFYPKQELVWLAYKAGKDIVLDLGRRSGKTRLIAEIIIEDMEDHGKDCLYVAISQVQGREIIWPVFKEVLHGQEKKWVFSEQRLELKYVPTGAVCSIKGADLGKDRLRGGAKRIIACDEFAFFRDPTIVKDVLIPQLADYNGQMIYASTPKGKNHFWKLKQRALNDPKFFTIHGTMFDNPFISPEGREKLLAEYSSKDDPLYRQEVMAEYVVFEGMVFALDQDSYTENRWDPADLTHSWHWRGIDHGFLDPTAALWLAFNERKGHYQIYSEYCESKLLIKDHADLIRSREEYPIISSYSDLDPQVIQEYKAVGLDMVPAEKTSQEMRKAARFLNIVNALRTGKLKIANNCKKLLEEMASYTWDQDGNDHLCFIAGTMVETDQGLRPIEQIKVGDMILTRQGYKPATAACSTGFRNVITLSFSDGRTLTCTPDHPFWTNEDGFVRADKLTRSHTFVSADQCQNTGSQNRFDSTAGAIVGIQTHQIGRCKGISELMAATASFIVTFGNSIMGQFLKVTTFIIKMAIPSTTTFLTSSVYLGPGIGLSIEKSALHALDSQSSLSILKRFEISQKNGTLQKKVLSGTGNTPWFPLLISQEIRKRLAWFAGKSISFVKPRLVAPSAAPIIVEPRADVVQASTMKPGSVQLVGGCSEQISTAKSKTAHKLVRLSRVERSGKAEVFNLTVSEAHEYYANGLLASNCDALNYVWNNKTLPRQPMPVAPPPSKFTHFPGQDGGGFDQSFDD